MRVDPDGNTLLTHLLDATRQRIDPGKEAEKAERRSYLTEDLFGTAHEVGRPGSYTAGIKTRG